jgi:hypothetical protein
VAGEGIHIPITGDASGFSIAMAKAAAAVKEFGEVTKRSGDSQALNFQAYAQRVQFYTQQYRTNLSTVAQISQQSAQQQIYHFNQINKSLYETFTRAPQSNLAQYRATLNATQQAHQAMVQGLKKQGEILTREFERQADAEAKVARVRGNAAVQYLGYVDQLVAKSNQLRQTLTKNAETEAVAEQTARATGFRQQLDTAVAFQSQMYDIAKRGAEQRRAWAAQDAAVAQAAAKAQQDLARQVQTEASVAAREAARGQREHAAALRDVGHMVKDLLSGKGLPSLITQMLGVGAAGAGIYKAFQIGRSIYRKVVYDFNELGESIYRLKLTTGDSTESVSALRYAAQMAGVSSLSLEMRWAQFSKALVGNSKHVRALGIEYKYLNGTTKSAFQLMGEVGDKLSQMSDAEKREAIALGLFGRGFKDILPLLAQGSKGMEEFRKHAKDAGVILSDKDLIEQRKFIIAQRELKATFEGLAFQIGKALAPRLITFFNAIREGVSYIINFVKANKDAQTALKLFGLAFMFAVSPITAIIALLGYLVQRFEPFGEALINITGVLGNLAGKGLAVAVKAFQYFLDAFILLVGGFLKLGEVLTGNRVWKFFFGDGAHEAITNAMGVLSTAKAGMDKFMDGFAQTAWDKGGDYATAFAKGFVGLMKKLKFKKSDLNLGWPEGGLYDPSIPGAGGAGGGGGGQRKHPLLAYFENLVKQSRDVLNTLRDKAIQVQREMKQLADSTAQSLGRALSLQDVSSAVGIYSRPTRLIAMFKKRLADMREYVDNLRRLGAMGLPPEMLSDLANMGLVEGARLAKTLVSNPTMIPQFAEIQAQISAVTQEGGQVVSRAIMGRQATDALSAAMAAQRRFQDLLGYSKKFGYSPSKTDIEAASTNISQQIQMAIQSNADPAVIEQAIAWALKTGALVYTGGRYRDKRGKGFDWSPYARMTPSSGSNMMPDFYGPPAPPSSGTMFQPKSGLQGPTKPYENPMQGPHLPHGQTATWDAARGAWVPDTSSWDVGW